MRGLPREGLGCSGVKGQLWGAKTDRWGADPAERGATVGVDVILSNGVHHTVLSRGQL